MTLINLMTAITAERSEDPLIRYVTCFENKGAIMGCSNPHPHIQTWSTSFDPDEQLKEQNPQEEYYESNNHNKLLMDYLAIERQLKERYLFQQGDVHVLVPWWAKWPFETMVLFDQPYRNLMELTDDSKRNLTIAQVKIDQMYWSLFGVDMPYSWGWHQNPFNDSLPHDGHSLHAHYYPPLLRSATVRKFMVGYEMLGNAQRDITAEMAAARMREVYHLD